MSKKEILKSPNMILPLKRRLLAQVLIGQHLQQQTNWTTSHSKLIHSKRDNNSLQAQVFSMFLKSMQTMLQLQNIKVSMWIIQMTIWKSVTIFILIFCHSSNKFQLHQPYCLNTQLPTVWSQLIWFTQRELGQTLTLRSNWKKIIQTTIQLKRNLINWDLPWTIISISMKLLSALNLLKVSTKSQLFIAAHLPRLLRSKILQATWWLMIAP